MKNSLGSVFSIKILLCAFVCLFIFYGCSFDTTNSNDSANENMYAYGYEDGYDYGYNAGYDDGYDSGYEDSLSEALLSFQSKIITLVYDHEYETVNKLLDYYPEIVETALKNEFGVKDLAPVIDYLETLGKP